MCPPALPQVRFHLPVWLGVGDALTQMIKNGKLELLQVHLLPACRLLPAPCPLLAFRHGNQDSNKTQEISKSFVDLFFLCQFDI